MSGWDGVERRSNSDRRDDHGRRDTDHPIARIHPEDLDRIGSTIAEQMQTRFSIPSATHKCHHDFIESVIKREERKSAFINKIVESSATWALIGLLGFVGLSIWEHFKKSVNP